MKVFLLFIFYCFLLNTQILFAQSGWSFQKIGNTELTDVIFLNSNTGFISGNLLSGNIFYKTTNSGLNWIGNNTGNGNILELNVFDESNINLLGTIGNYGMIRHSSNGGSIWNDYYFSANLEIMNPQRMDWLDIYTGYCIFIDYGYSNYYGRLFRTSNGGINWNEQYPLPNAAFYDVKIYNEDTAFLLASNLLMRTTDKGNQWAVYGNMGGYSSTNLFFPNFDTIYSAGTEIKRSIDKGINWSILLTVPINKSINKMWFINSKTGWAVGGGSSIYNHHNYIVKTSNAGINWQIQDSNNYKCLRSVFFLDENTGWAVGDSGTILKTTTGGSVFVIKISDFIPDKFILEQNYPNPFNSSTIIKFNIPKSGFIKLTISDLLGKEIESPVNEYKKPGIYQYIFNSGNLSSGIYFYRLQIDNFVQTKKMVIIK